LAFRDSGFFVATFPPICTGKVNRLYPGRQAAGCA
jgi:hypothetical protein